MLKNLLASVAVCALSTAAMAADLPARKTATAPVIVAAPFNWTGFYVGAHGGAVWTKPNYDDGVVNNPTLRSSVFGALAGYNFQSGNLVFGVEGDVGFGSGSELAQNGYSKFSMPWNGHVRGRLGYSFGSALFFAAGGVAFANLKVDDIDAGYGKFSNNHVGWTLGGGVDYALSKNWIVRAEYLYDGYNSKTSTVPYYDTGKGQGPYQARVKPNSQTVRAGLAYKF